jgi:hypothetical protein
MNDVAQWQYTKAVSHQDRSSAAVESRRLGQSVEVVNNVIALHDICLEKISEADQFRAEIVRTNPRIAAEADSLMAVAFVGIRRQLAILAYVHI